MRRSLCYAISIAIATFALVVPTTRASATIDQVSNWNLVAIQAALTAGETGVRASV
jgi:hypothetical protein